MFFLLHSYILKYQSKTTIYIFKLFLSALLQNYLVHYKYYLHTCLNFILNFFQLFKQQILTHYYFLLYNQCDCFHCCKFFSNFVNYFNILSSAVPLVFYYPIKIQHCIFFLKKQLSTLTPKSDNNNIGVIFFLIFSPDFVIVMRIMIKKMLSNIILSKYFCNI